VKADPYLGDLVAKGLLKNDARYSGTPWWIVTKRGRELIDLYVEMPSKEKALFLRSTYGALER
jgi:hypothetical protein